MPVLASRGVELAWAERGRGAPVLLIHETAATGTVWDPLADALSGDARVLSYDRRGWGSSTAPDGYQRTTIEEQSEDAASLLDSASAAPAVVAGAGIGAVIALDLLLRRSELVSGAVLIEPTLFGLLPAATEVLSDDRVRLHEALASGGTDEAARLFLSGELEGLGPGIARQAKTDASERPVVLFAELGATAAWATPLSALGRASRPSAIVTAPSTPRLVREAAAALADRLSNTSLKEIDAGDAPPHVGAPAELAAIVVQHF
jgi:pimeloyl-ACP methyl ester carboxylesterase